MTIWTENGLFDTWEALKETNPQDKWRFAPLGAISDIIFYGGFRRPENQRAVIIEFPDAAVPKNAKLVCGQGFETLKISEQDLGRGRTAVALIDRSTGTDDIFPIMAIDILRNVEAIARTSPVRVFSLMQKRLREWQAFMSNQTQKPLSPDQQCGLLGELHMLQSLVRSSNSTSRAISMWRGPLRAAQDFHVEGGAIEVKSTMISSSFIATINSIDQLESDKSPLFLCTLRFSDDADGRSLADMVASLQADATAAGVYNQFQALLICSGYLEGHKDHYTRLVSLKEARCFAVDNKFPRLSRAELPSAIRQARYSLDTTLIEADALSIEDMLCVYGF